MFQIGDGDIITDKDGQPILDPKHGQEGFWNKKECVWYIGLAWITLDEYYELRQKDPRLCILP